MKQLSDPLTAALDEKIRAIVAPFIRAEVAAQVSRAVAQLPRTEATRPKKLLKVKEAAAYLNVVPRTIYLWIEEDKTFPVRRVGTEFRFDSDELAEWTKRRGNGAPAERTERQLRAV